MRRHALPTWRHVGGLLGGQACTAGTWACPWSAPAGTRTETWALVCSAGMHSRHLDKAQHVPVLQEEACTAANLASGRSAQLWEGMPDKDLGMPRCADCSKPGGHQQIAVQEHHHEVHTVGGDVQRRWAGSPLAACGPGGAAWAGRQCGTGCCCNPSPAGRLSAGHRGASASQTRQT